MAKNYKSEALHKKLGNNIGYCAKCEKKHPKGEHTKKEKEGRKESEEEMNKKEENGDQE